MESRNDLKFYQMLGWYTFFNLALLVEGALRIARFSVPATASSDGFPAGLLLFSAVIEAAYSIAGLMLCFAYFTVDKERVSVKLTQAVVFSGFAGWVIFIVFALAEPIFTISSLDSEAPLLFRVAALFGAITYCAGLQGGQIFIGLEVMFRRKQLAGHYTSSYYQKRVCFYAINTTIAGLAMLVAASDVAARSSTVGFVEPAPGISLIPPFLVIYPIINIIHGLLTTALGLWAIGIFATFKAASITESDSDWFAYATTAVVLLQIVLIAFMPPGIITVAEAAAEEVILAIPFIALPSIIISKMRTEALEERRMQKEKNLPHHAENKQENKAMFLA